MGKPAKHRTQARFVLGAGDREIIVPIPSDEEELPVNQTQEVAAPSLWGLRHSVALEAARSCHPDMGKLRQEDSLGLAQAFIVSSGSQRYRVRHVSKQN